MSKKKKTYTTKSGRVLTDDDIEKLAAEAEKGYDVQDEQVQKAVQALPEPGKYVRYGAIMGRLDGKGEHALIRSKGQDTLIVETVALDPKGRDIIGKIKFAERDEFRPYSTSIAIFNNGGWERVEDDR